MRHKVLLLLIAVNLCRIAPLFGSAIIPWNELTLQNGCALSRSDLSQGRRFPGSFCVFLPDGSFISAGNQGLRRIDMNGNTLWEKSVVIHHQLSLSPDGKRVLGLGNVVSQTPNGPRRFDVFFIFDLLGNETHRRSAQEVLLESKVSPLEEKLLPPIEEYHGVGIEGSHFNSIQQIPAVEKKTGVHPSFKEGNIIVNGLRSGIFVLSSDLKKTLFHFTIPNSLNHQVHDVQVRSSGDVLYFNNFMKGAKLPSSRVETWDPVQKKIGLSIGPQESAYFHTPSSGSAQELPDGTFLFTHVLAGGFFADPKGNIVGSFFGGVGDPPYFVPFQNVRAWDLTEFLKKNRYPSKP